MSPPTIVAPENYKYPSLRPMLTFFVFIVLGPAIGGVTFVVLSLIAGLVSDFGQHGWVFNRPEAFLGVLVFIQPFAYLLGGLQAFAVAGLAAIFHLRDPNGSVPLVPVLVGSVLCGSVFLGLMSRGGVPSIGASLLLLLVHLGAGLGCWLIANALLWLFGSRRFPSMRSA